MEVTGGRNFLIAQSEGAHRVAVACDLKTVNYSLDLNANIEKHY